MPKDPNIVRVGLVQTNATRDKRANTDRTVALIRDAAKRGAQIVCLQELFATQYPCQEENSAEFDSAEPVPGDTTTEMGALAKELGVSLIVSLFEKRAPGLHHNTAVVVTPDGAVAGMYRKMHIPDDPHYYEKFYFAPGDLGFVAIETPHAQVGPLVCWDQWYPEAARLTALRGAQILFYPTAIGWIAGDEATVGAAQLDAWKTMQRSHAIANGVWVVAVNRVGHEGPKNDGIDFWGHSFVSDPFGRVVAEAGEEEEVLVVDCDLALQEQTRRDWPFLRDRRIDAYSGIEKRYLDTKRDS